MKWSQAEQPTVFVVTSSSTEIFALLTQFLAALEQLEEHENSVMPKFAIKLLVVPLIFFWCFCSLIQIPNQPLAQPPNNALLANIDIWGQKGEDVKKTQVKLLPSTLSTDVLYAFFVVNDRNKQIWNLKIAALF